MLLLLVLRLPLLPLLFEAEELLLGSSFQITRVKSNNPRPIRVMTPNTITVFIVWYRSRKETQASSRTFANEKKKKGGRYKIIM